MDVEINLHSDNMSTNTDTEGVAAVPHGVDDAVGVGSRKWYVAIVNNNTEKAVQERLIKLGYETYVAKQVVIRVWKNGRKAKVDKVVIPSVVFVKCTEAERREIVTLSFINRFLTNKAATSAHGLAKPPATIPQAQIDLLRFMLGQSELPVSFVETFFRKHDKVVVIRGNLKGLEGEVIQAGDGKSEVIVRIDILGSAKVTIDTISLQKVGER